MSSSTRVSSAFLEVPPDWYPNLDDGTLAGEKRPVTSERDIEAREREARDINLLSFTICVRPANETLVCRFDAQKYHDTENLASTIKLFIVLSHYRLPR